MDISLTEAAAKKVKEIAVTENMEDTYLRVKIQGGGCSGFAYDLYFDKPQEDDIHIDSHGVKIIVDNMSVVYLDGTIIDYIETLQGAGFKFSNPAVKSTCGCGSSVSF